MLWKIQNPKSTGLESQNPDASCHHLLSVTPWSLLSPLLSATNHPVSFLPLLKPSHPFSPEKQLREGPLRSAAGCSLEPEGGGE